MDIFFTVVLGFLWLIFAVGLVVVTFTNFEHIDLNVLVLIVFFFAAINTFLKVNKNR